jgi:hypothetical protein
VLYNFILNINFFLNYNMHIYKITNLINGKIYIGLSTEKDKFRWYKHCGDAKNNPKNLIDRAIAKYGQNNLIVKFN